MTPVMENVRIFLRVVVGGGGFGEDGSVSLGGTFRSRWTFKRSSGAACSGHEVLLVFDATVLNLC